jgi:NAD+ kinase
MTGPRKKNALRSIAVVAKRGPREAVDVARELARWAEGRGVRVRFDDETSRALRRKDGFPRDRLPRGTDLAVVAGGDGTLLSVARVAGPLGVPILGVNLGGLGFLTELQPDELFSGLTRVLAGDFTIEERQTLRVRLHRRRGAPIEHALLNDAVITKAALARMITLAMRIDGDEVATYTSDGLILATPTGSTAYSLSAGGPILHPSVNALVVAPICPHTMTHRPLVVPGDARVRVTLTSVVEEAYLTLDGQVGYPFRHADAVVVDTHPRPVRLVRVSQRSFFDVLRRKLRWGER